MSKLLLNSIKAVAVIVLLAFAWIFRGGGTPESPGYFVTHWWGILGLIGWAYLVSAVVFTLSRSRFNVVIMAWLLFLFLCIANHAGWLSSIPYLKRILSPFGGGAMPALVTGGVLTSMIFIHFRQKGENGKLIGLLFGFSILLLAVGFYTRTFWGISKIRATPAWVLICSAITIVTFLIVFWIADLKSKANWFAIIRPAGNNTLLCYLVPYFAYTVVTLLHLSLPAALRDGGVGLLKSVLFSLLVVGITGLLGKAGLRLRL